MFGSRVHRGRRSSISFSQQENQLNFWCNPLVRIPVLLIFVSIPTTGNSRMVRVL